MSNLWEVYQKSLAEGLRAIDVFLRTQPPPYAAGAVAGLLGLAPERVEELCRELGVEELGRAGFLRLMQAGESPLCRAFARELERGLPQTYSPADVAYIYGIDIDVVLQACAGLGLTRVDGLMLQLLLYAIPA